MIQVFIDGFNFYHVIQDYYERRGENLKNLDYRKMMAEVASVSPEKVQVHFFTAKPTHMGYDKQIRHQKYTQALKSMGVKVYEGRFKTEMDKCKADCKLVFEAWREKQTDVSLAIHLLHEVQQNPQGKFTC